VKRYPLQAVVDQREAAREAARRALAEAVRALEEEEQRLAEAERARAALDAEREAARLHLYDPDEAGMLPLPLIERRTEGLRHVERRLTEARERVEERRHDVVSAQHSLEERRQGLVQAEKDLKTVERHRETWRAAQKREEVRRDERQSAEVVLARYAAERGGEGSEET
jgi:chromosome segregation ATPase